MTAGGARAGTLALAATCAALACLTWASSALAATPHWIVSVQAAPAHFEAGSRHDFYEIVAENDGAAPTSGEVTLTDVLPAAVTATEVGTRFEGGAEPLGDLAQEMGCALAGATITCTTSVEIPVGGVVVAKIDVDVSAEVDGSVEDRASLSGGNAPEATAAVTTPVAAEPVSYGASITSELIDDEGGLATAAGSHPFAFTTLLSFNIGPVDTRERCFETAGCGEVAANTKSVDVAMPPGLVGDPGAVPLCPQAAFQAESNVGCPAESQVGAVLLLFGKNTAPQYSPVYDIEPPPGRAAELGFTIGPIAHVPIYLDVRSDSDYGITADIPEVSEFDPVVAAALSLWGVPAASGHNRMRKGIGCEPGPEGCPGPTESKPFLTTPTSCSEEGLSISLASDSWQQPLSPVPTLQRIGLAGMSGCAALPFAPWIASGPTSLAAESPTGYDVTLGIPQREGPEEPATAAVRDARVALPVGTVISTASGNGLIACSETAFEPHSRADGRCPPQSRIGTVRILTPLLLSPMTGGVYIAQPSCDPCDPGQAEAGQMVRLYLEARGPGAVVKLVGQTSIEQATGQLTTTFDEDPQLPFSEVAVDIEGGQDAPLANGDGCETVAGQAALTPWSGGTPIVAGREPGVVEPLLSASADCGHLPFAPTFSAGMTGTAAAGAFSGFALTIARPDRQQALGNVVVHAPPGIAADIASVPLCKEPQANAGTCGVASQIGEATVLAGPGTQPFAIEGGRVYLTGPYGGAPFGLSIVVPASIGPFHLAGQYGGGEPGDGNVVIRASVALDPRTTALTIATSQLPSRLDGVPLQARKLIVDLDRRGFVFDPTSCEASSIDATIASAEGATAAASYPFQATGCAQLPFAPKMTVTTHAAHSRKDGVYFNVQVTTKAGEANVHKVHVTLPGKLPARLDTLKLACTEAQFASDPSGCPAGSIVGTATAQTGVLPVPLTGPAIFVSRGGAEFPNLDLVMQGDGVTIVLEGDTYINQNGVTSSTFGTIPDVPVSSIDVELPAQSNSALAATGDLCRSPLRMPMTITGQNGAVVDADVKLRVMGCRPQIEVVAHQVKDSSAQIGVNVPGAGRLIATGHGIARRVKRLPKAKTATLAVRLRRRERRLLHSHPGRRLRVDVRLRFVPRRGRTLSSHVTVLMR